MTAQILEATPELDQHNNIVWTLCDKVKNQCGGKTQFPTISLPATTGSTPFNITINDIHHLGVIFANDSNDPFADKDANGAIWIQQGHNNCPTQAVWDTDNQIATATRASDVKITFVDLNTEHGPLAFTYQLNFTMNGKAVTPLDPIIDNGGCCVHKGFLPTSTSEFAVDLAIAFFVGVVVALLVRQFLSSRR
jgi:hypothetical protein